MKIVKVRMRSGPLSANQLTVTVQLQSEAKILSVEMTGKGFITIRAMVSEHAPLKTRTLMLFYDCTTFPNHYSRLYVGTTQSNFHVFDLGVQDAAIA
jgi:hypothetical protein